MYSFCCTGFLQLEEKDVKAGLSKEGNTNFVRFSSKNKQAPTSLYTITKITNQQNDSCIYSLV